MANEKATLYPEVEYELAGAAAVEFVYDTLISMLEK